MKFEQAVIDEVVKVALRNHIAPAALLAVVEVESAGRALEEDGKTPRLLFERHVFHKELAKRQPGKLQAAIAQGMAIPKWNRALQYRDQGSSHGRLVVVDRARAIDEDCANRSCSWGVGQTMGFLAEGQGFRTATDMVNSMVVGGIPAQVACMVREIKNRKLDGVMNRAEWAKFARSYNGPGYAQNKYDVKMAAAYDKWMRKLIHARPSEVDDHPIDIPLTRNAEPPKTMATSKIGNAQIATGVGTATTVGSAIVKSATDGDVTASVPDFADKVNDAVEKGGTVIEVTRNAAETVADAAPLWKVAVGFLTDPAVLTIIGLGIIAACAYAWWQRRRHLQEDGV